MKKYILLLVLLLSFHQVSLAAFGLYDMEKLNNKLSNNAILCMHQDDYGFMWIGTYDGLNLYDGNTVTTFRYERNNPNSLSGNNIHIIHSATADYLWVGTQIGLDKFSIKDRKVVETYPEYKKVQLIAVNSERNETWIVSKDNHIDYYDSCNKRFNRIAYDIRKNDIRSLFVDTYGHLCVVKSDGNLQIISKKNDSGGELSGLAAQTNKIHEKSINQVFYEDGNIYFIDDDANLFLYDLVRQRKMLLRNISDLIEKYSNLNSLVFFQNDIFLAFMYSGFIKLNMSTHDKFEPIDTTIGVFGLLKDNFQDAIWVGTDGRGVELYYFAKDKFSNILFDNLPFIARRPVRSFYTDGQNRLWIGTKGDGIIQIKDYDKFNNAKIPSNNVQRIRVRTSFYDAPIYAFIRSEYNNQNDLWMASDDGLLYYSYKDDHTYKVEDIEKHQIIGMHTLCEVNDSVLWIPQDGIYRVVIDKTKYPYRIKSKQKISIKRNDVVLNDEYYAMTFDGVSKIFLGSRRGYGVLRIDIHTFEYDFISMDNAQNKGIGDIMSLLLDKDSTLYVGTGSGLTQIKMYKDKGNEIKQFGRHNGIINDMIHGILKDENGIIWLSTNKGLVKYNTQNESFFNVNSSHIGVSEYSDDAYWFCPITKRLFFGGINGLVWIESTKGKEDSSYKPKLMFTDVRYLDTIKTLYDYNQDSSKVLVLDDNQNTFQITFTVLDYIHSENYDFSYMLENYDTDWNTLQKNTKIQFTKLPFGSYILKVRYKSDVTHAENNVYELRIKILPPWYFSVVARIIYIVLIIVSLLLLYFYFRKKLKSRQEALAKRIKEEQKEKMYESKLRFFTNVTHEFFTPLTLIKGAVEQIGKDNESTNIKKYVDILRNNVQSLNELIQEVLDYRKVEELGSVPLVFTNLNVSKLLYNIVNSMEGLGKQNVINFTIEIEDDLYWYTDLGCVKKIISNLLSNAFKYTPVGGKVKISVYTEDNNLKIVVYNTGRGIEHDKIDKLFSRYRILEDTNVNANNQMTARHGLGLHICNSMTRLLQGNIQIESRINEFTEFVVTLPNLSSEISVVNKAIETIDENDEHWVGKQEIANVDVERFDTDSKLVLIVDDNPDIVELISDVLSKNYAVKGLYSATEALVFLKEQTPELIITDIMMPDIDGLSFTKKVREDKYNKQIPIIALTAKVSDRDQIMGYDIGVDAYVTKPFSSDVLLSIVNRLLVNKDNVKEYYDSVESALEYNQGKLMHQKDREFIEDVNKIINENISDTKLGPEFIAEKMKISSRNLYRQLKKILDIAPSDYIKDYKLFYASKLLITTNLSIKEIVYKVGISNKSFFYREFAKKYNVSPRQYKDSYKNSFGKEK